MKGMLSGISFVLRICIGSRTLSVRCQYIFKKVINNGKGMGESFLQQ